MTAALWVLCQAVRLGEHSIPVQVHATAEARHEALRSAGDGALLLVWPAGRFIHLHSGGLDRRLEVAFLSADGKILETASLSPDGATPAVPATAALVVPRGRLREAGAVAGGAAVLPALEKIEPPDAVGFRGREGRVFVELAVTATQRERGMMHRRRLSPDDGMLFKYAGEAEHRYWMKDTHVSLDLAFLKADGTIRKIHRGLKTDEEVIRYPSDGPVQYALETNAGWFAGHGIVEGDTAEIPERVRALKADP